MSSRIALAYEGRFWAKVARVPAGCWEWVAYRAGDGYGRFRIGGRSGKAHLAHRVAYELSVGPIPEGLELDHLCRNRGCVNPAHLEPVTHRENQLRGPRHPSKLQAAKTHCPRGHPYDETNTAVYVTGRGWTNRRCRTCSRELGALRARRYRAERRRG